MKRIVIQADSDAHARLPALFLEGVSRPQRFAEALRLLAESLGVEQAAVRIWDRRGSWACVRDARRVERGWHLSADDLPNLHAEWRGIVSTLAAERWQRFRVLNDRSRSFEFDLRSASPSATSLALRLTMHNGAEGLLLLKVAPHQALDINALPRPTGELIKSLQHALELMAQLRQLNHRLVCSNLLLDAIRLPLLLLDPAMRMLAANSHAQPLLERAANGAGKRHVALRGVCSTKLTLAVRGACDIAPRAVGSILRITSVPTRQVLVLPIMIRHAGQADRAALVLMHGQSEPTELQGSANRLLQQVYGLTPAESRLAMMILDGHAPSDAASSLKVSVATVRTQLSAILKKTGARKQTELVRHLSPLMVLDQPLLALKDRVT
ncbi:MAG: helix-turn-helix transcriptional regulator [Oxalobacteraceae bacterium]